MQKGRKQLQTKNRNKPTSNDYAHTYYGVKGVEIVIEA